MGKKIIRLTESDLYNVVNKVIQEQVEEANIIKGVQNFLNKKINANLIDSGILVVDGKTGPNSQTSKAIEKYQHSIGVNPTDGVWGSNTYRKMPKEDKEMLKDSMAEEGDILDKILHRIGVK